MMERLFGKWFEARRPGRQKGLRVVRMLGIVPVLAVCWLLTADPASVQAFDGCRYPGQGCICDNTGWRGRCDPGPLKPGLYCHCDRPRNHDGCRRPGQRCTCGNTGWPGACDRGPIKDGLYCHCD